MAAMTMGPEPDVGRFIDTYKFDQQMEDRRQQFGGGTSLPLHSDGYEDKQKKLRDERRVEMMHQQEKQPKESAYYRVGTPEQGLSGLGSYEQQRQEHNKQRQMEYNQMMKKQRQLEQQKLEARHRSPPRPVQQAGPQVDYQANQQQARAEDRRAYQDYMKAKEEKYWAQRGRPVTPNGGLDIGHYDRNLKETAQQKKDDYRQDLLRQQKEHMFLRARQENEIPVIDRTAQQAQNLASKPPPAPGHRSRDDNESEQKRRDEMHQMATGRPAEVVKNQYYSSDDYEHYQKGLQKKQSEEYRDFLQKKFQPSPGAAGLPIGQYVYEPTRLAMEAERNKEYNELLKKGSPRFKNTQLEGPQGLNIDVNFPHRKKAWLEKQRNEEYNKFLEESSPRHKAATPPDQQGLPIGQQFYAPMYKAMEHQRNKEYNDFLHKKYNHKLRATQSEPDQDRTSFYLGNEMTHEERRRLLERERHREYNDMLQKQPPPTNREMPVPSDVESGLSIGQHHHEVWKKFLRDQRNQEYNQLVETKNQQVSNRGWDHNQTGILELRGEDATRNHQQELRSQLRSDYNSYINKEGDGQVKKTDLPKRAQSEPAPKQQKHINPIVQSMGRYEEIRNQLKEVRKDEFRKFQEQHKGEAIRRPRSKLILPRIAGEETPLVYKMSNYEENTGKLMLAQRRKDFQEFKEDKLKHLTPRSTVKENVMPHVASSETPLVNHMGHYDEERRRYQLQRSKEQREYVSKKKEEHHSPYEHYVFPTVAIAEKPVVENMGIDVAQRQQHLREERKRDYERYQLQQRMNEAPRRHDYVDPTNGPYSGLFAGLGDHGNSKEILKSQRKQEYHDHMEKYSDRGRSPMRNTGGPPDQYPHGQADHYQQMLDEKRREEAHRRRFDDPEIQDRFAQNSRDQQRYNY